MNDNDLRETVLCAIHAAAYTERLLLRCMS